MEGLEEFYEEVKKRLAELEVHEKKISYRCGACEIEANDRQVKQMPRHTCGKDGRVDMNQLQEENEKLVYSNSVLGESWHRLNEENKRLREERDRAVDILKQFVRGDIKDLLLPSEKRLINTFLDQLNQQNEG